MWSRHPRVRDRLAVITPAAPVNDATANAFDAPEARRGGHRLLDASPASLGAPEDSSAQRMRWFTAWDPRARKAALAMLAGLGLVIAWWWWSGQPEPVQPVADATVVDAEGFAVDGALQEASAVVVVHVVGKVAAPGLVELPMGARVHDAIEAAGGATRDKALESVNLARPVIDGEQIVVGMPAEGSSPTTMSINSASAGELDELPGIGPVIAERIVQWREENGPFTSIDELAEVSGVGPSIIEQIRDQVGM